MEWVGIAPTSDRPSDIVPLLKSEPYVLTRIHQAGTLVPAATPPPSLRCVMATRLRFPLALTPAGMGIEC